MVCKRFLAVLTVLVSLAAAVSAQELPGAGRDPGRRLERIRELFDNDMYTAARDEIRSAVSECVLSDAQMSELAAYRIMCDIRLGSPDLEALMEEYASGYRYAPEYMAVRLSYAGYCFDREDFRTALEVLETVDPSLLSREDKAAYLFRISFCRLALGMPEEAETGFIALLEGRRNIYRVPATYYLGYIAYLHNDFEEAVRLFSDIVDDGHFGVFCSYYILESEFMLGDFEYVTAHGEEVSMAVGADMRPRVDRMISEAYYSLGQPEQARKWFENYSASGADMSRKDNYYLGVISYSLQSYYAAVDAFAEVIGVEDSLAQSACMHMAGSYLKLKNKHEALKYYRMASEMDFDKEVKEESYFNYAKLAFDVNSDIAPFQDYLSLWPENGRSDEIYSYIATSYLLSRQYKSAVDALERIRSLTPEMEMNLQKAAFLRGLELYGRGAYGAAVSDLRLSLQHSGQNRTLALLASFWLAETLYMSGEADEAEVLYEGLVNEAPFKSFAEYPLAFFGLGYCAYALGEDSLAVTRFGRFLQMYDSDMDLVIEARLRMADAMFRMRDYAGAASVYEEVSKMNYQQESSVYAAYQCAVSYGLISETGRKISVLEGIISRRDDTPMYSRAVYELGRTYVQEGMADKATRCFRYLLDDIGDPMYKSKALLELGMICSNAGDYEEALSYLTRIVEQMPLSEDTDNALAAMESIYTVLNQPQEYFAYLDRVGMSSAKTPDEKELMVFNAAEQVYLSGDYKAAENSLRAFVSQYPDGQKTPLAWFYLGEALYAMDRKEDALAAYQEVMDKGQGSFVELSTLQYAGICYDLERYAQAASAYEALYPIARLGNNKTEALKGLMNSYYGDGRYNMAVDAAENLLAVPGLDADYAVQARYIMARSYMSLGRREQALPVLKELSGNVFAPEGAEAAYILIQDTYDAGDFEEVENKVYAFSDSKTDQTYWLARSFIVLGDSFAEREEWAQARATFESIRDGYVPEGNRDDILEQVNMRIERLDKIAGQ